MVILSGRKKQARGPREAGSRPAGGEPGGHEAGAREVDLRLKAAVERAGGNGVWVKGWSSASGDAWRPPRAGQAIEVVAATRVSDAVLSAIEGEANRQGLEVRLSEPGGRTPHPGGVEEITVLRDSKAVSRWRVREVPRIYRASIVIDDLGEDLEVARQLLRLPYPLTFSVLPGLTHSAAIAEEAHRDGREVMLHLPMEAQSFPREGSPAPGRGVIEVGMPRSEVAEIIEADLASVPHAHGANNHMGSRATADQALMGEVMETLAERHLYFIDSRTTASTVAYDAARRQGVPAFFRSVFLDDEENVAYSLDQLRRFRRIVEEQGAALAIGHPHPTTIEALTRFLPELELDNIELVPPSELVRLPEVARILPPRRPAL